MINKAIVEGRLTKDIDLRKTQDGRSVCTFSLASDSGLKDHSGNKITDFVSVTAWGQNADFLDKYCEKGALLSVEGRIIQRVREIETRKVYTNEVNAERVNILAHKQNTGGVKFDTGTEMIATEDDLPW